MKRSEFLIKIEQFCKKHGFSKPRIDFNPTLTDKYHQKDPEYLHDLIDICTYFRFEDEDDPVKKE